MKENMSEISKFVSLFVKPKELYESIKETPVIKVVLCVVILLTLITTILSNFSVASSQEFINSQMVELTGKLGGELAEEGGMIETLIGGVIGGFVVVAIIAISSLFTVILVKLFGGENSFKNFFAMDLYNTVFETVFSLISILIAILLNTHLNILSLSAVFASSRNFFDPIYILLSSITIYGLYRIYLNIIGIKIIGQFESYVKPIIISLIIFIVPLILSYGAATIFYNTLTSM